MDVAQELAASRADALNAVTHTAMSALSDIAGGFVLAAVIAGAVYLLVRMATRDHW